MQRLPKQRHGHLLQPHVAPRRPHTQVALVQQVVAVEQLLAAHVLVARGHVALLDVELVGPARDGVLVVADQRVLALDQVPGAGPPAEGIDLIPAQVPPPAADGVPRRATPPAGQDGEAQVLHLVEVVDPLQADEKGEDAGQQAALQGAVVVGQAAPGGAEPGQGLAHQQEGAGVLRAAEQKGGAGGGASVRVGPGKRIRPGCSAGAGAAAGGATGCSGGAAEAAAAAGACGVPGTDVSRDVSAGAS